MWTCVCVLDHFLILIVMRCYVQVINADMFITYLASVLSCGGHRIARRHLIPSRTRDVIYIYMKRSNKNKNQEVCVTLVLSPVQIARLTQWSNLLLKNINIDGVFVVGRTIKAVAVTNDNLQKKLDHIVYVTIESTRGK